MKTIKIVVIFLLLLAMTSCQNTSFADPKADISPSVGGEDIAQDTGGGDSYIPTLETYESYVEFISENAENLPDNFVHYSDVAAYGEFDVAIFLSHLPATKGTYLDYIYGFANKAGERIWSLRIYHAPETPGAEHSNLVTLPDGWTDLTKVPVPTTPLGASLVLGDIIYEYNNNGALVWIEWSVDDITFVLDGDFEKNQSNACMREWLKANTAQKALQEHTLMIKDNMGEKPDNPQNEFAQHSALEIDDSIRSALGVKRDQRVIRVHICPIIFAFDAYNSIEEILKSNYILQTRYAVVDGDNVVSVHQFYGGEPMEVNSSIPNDVNILSALMSNVVLKELPKGATVLDVYYLNGHSDYMGSALYYQTDMGDFVYYKCYDTGGKQYLFPASDFFALVKETYAEMLKHSEEMGNTTIESVCDLSKYEVNFTEADMRSGVAWWHILLGVSSAILAVGLVAFGISVYKKKRLVENSEGGK